MRVLVEGEERTYEKGTTFETIANDYQEKYDHQIALVIVNGKMKELFKDG